LYILKKLGEVANNAWGKAIENKGCPELQRRTWQDKTEFQGTVGGVLQRLYKKSLILGVND
jgi:hypothetical protein